MKQNPKTIKQILNISFLSVSIPALILLLVLTCYTISRQIHANQSDTEIQLSQVTTHMEEVLKRSETQLNNLVVPGSPFHSFHYSNTQLEKYQNAYTILQILRPILTQDSCLGGFFLYSKEKSDNCYYPSFQQHYSYEDQKLLKDYFMQPIHLSEERNRWIPFMLSDRVVLIRMIGYDTTICAVMVDPSLDNFSLFAGMSDSDMHLFYASLEGTPYTSEFVTRKLLFPYEDNPVRKITLDKKTYQFISSPVGEYNLQLCCIFPYKGIWSHMNLFQKVLISCMIALLFSISLIGMYLYRKLIYPINTLMETMQKVGNGNLSLRVNDNYDLLELQRFGQAFNEMLTKINDLKLEAYEKKLDLKQAQLQYLQLQIRPHFYLNCLKSLYGMAEKKQYGEIQESILALSEYFRYIFRNNIELVSLEEEIHSVSSYIKLQQLYFSCWPELGIDISADTTDVLVPPLSILTFVENSIKHCQDRSHIKIQLKTAHVSIEQQDYLNITISDNCGGFPLEALNTLNHLEEHDFLYKDYNVGIYNIYYRMKMIYENQSTLAFYNIENQGCVELLIPFRERKIES